VIVAAIYIFIKKKQSKNNKIKKFKISSPPLTEQTPSGLVLAAE
jgi:hypothetical protein